MKTAKTLYATAVKAVAGQAPRITISTDTIDSEGDVIVQDGLTFRSPLPVLFAHDARDLPVGATTSIIRQQGRTLAEWKWLEGDERAARVANAYSQGMLAASVGMLVSDAVPQGKGYLIRRALVTEFSLCASPANPDCVRVLKALGLTPRGKRYRDDEIVLDLDHVEIEPAELMRRCRSIIAEGVRDALSPIVKRELRDAMTSLTGRLD